MNIGEAANASGVSAKMIRYYESIGLIRPPHRTDSNYRVYGSDEVHVLRFIKRSRTLGFSVEETATLLSLWQDKSRASGEVKEVAVSHITALETKIDELQAMVKTLKHLAHCCTGNDRPDCPILDDLAGVPTPSKGH
ncbi:Cu(I)-responsive transcriptional regulator [Devosia sp. J2-20]|jgi:MerR family transcriptional regulator, copper efflux regulator|uniref:Cu(I)-responsive transcriptional regulator n=1 Tax=Devosia TaxID=46913 RepID=UPI0022AFEB6D|nr:MULTISPECIES: Cu(I)-responsive transcriptional regulator [Devosia]MCZ4344788.1 Cu(I)-responsive transcriptional regulator [Devosia neptuniae]WDQ97728.1 Cu(I)-responsive transcriptional regulator [Devosia sp. J2-20]|tara:strand:+ start:1973 stop:2383 length:411 start_codon:yes stop_codon:yes gene_type:complete